MRRWLLVGTLMLIIVPVGLVVHFRTDRTVAGAASLQAAHSTEFSHAAAEQKTPVGHEKEILETALRKRPGHAPVLLKLAEIESQEGRLQQSAGHLRALLAAEPDNPEGNLELGKVLFQLGDPGLAIRYTEKILKTHPNHEDALYNMGAIYANIGNRAKAMDYWNRLAALNTNSVSAQNAKHMMRRLSDTVR